MKDLPNPTGPHGSLEPDASCGFNLEHVASLQVSGGHPTQVSRGLCQVHS